MSAKTKIEWAEATWTPLRARRLDTGKVGVHCEKVSPGCANCYSETFNARMLPSHGTGLPFTRASRDKVEPFLDEKMLLQPLRWQAPKRIFVESQSDLFGEWVTDEELDRVFAVMSLAERHTFIVLTKRAERMHAYITSRPRDSAKPWQSVIGTEVADLPEIKYSVPWPLPNVWLGVSAEDQQRANERIPHLLATPAAVRWVSFEPLLGPIDYGNLRLLGETMHAVYPHVAATVGIDWAVIGGESGRKARPCSVEDVRSLLRQCRDAGVPAFVKQDSGPRPGMQGRIPEELWRVKEYPQ